MKNRLALLFLITTVMAVITSVVLGLALIHEAAESSAYSQQSYKIGLRDGESYTKGMFARALAERELIEEQQAKLAKGRL